MTLDMLNRCLNMASRCEIGTLHCHKVHIRDRQWRHLAFSGHCETSLTVLFVTLSLATNTCSLTTPAPGQKLGRSANSTAAGWSISTVSRSKTALSDLAALEISTTITGQMVLCTLIIDNRNKEVVLISAHQNGDGVWTHSFDNADVSWFSPR